MKTFYIIVFFSMVSLMGIFTSIFFYEIGKDTIISTLTNVTLTIQQDNNVSAQMQAHTQSLQDSYNAFIMPYDLMFIYLWVLAFIISVVATLKTKTESAFSFMTGIFFGIMGILLIVFFVDQIITWFFDEIFNPIFSDAVLDIPVTLFYFDNIGIISAIWFAILFLIRYIEIDFGARGRVQE